MTDDQQTTDAGEARAVEQPDPTVQAGDTLDEFLSSFDEQEDKSPETPRQTQTDDDPIRQELADLKRWRQEEEQRRTAESTSRLVGDLVSEMKSAVEMDGISDAFIRRHLLGAANDDPRWAVALTDPKGRSRAIRELSQEIKDAFGSVSEARTASERRSVKDSVRGLSTTPPEDDGKPISNSEFEAMSHAEQMKYLNGKRRSAGA